MLLGTACANEGTRQAQSVPCSERLHGEVLAILDGPRDGTLASGTLCEMRLDPEPTTQPVYEISGGSHRVIAAVGDAAMGFSRIAEYVDGEFVSLPRLGASSAYSPQVRGSEFLYLQLIAGTSTNPPRMALKVWRLDTYDSITVATADQFTTPVWVGDSIFVIRAYRSATGEPDRAELVAFTVDGHERILAPDLATGSSLVSNGIDRVAINGSPQSRFSLTVRDASSQIRKLDGWRALLWERDGRTLIVQKARGRLGEFFVSQGTTRRLPRMEAPGQIKALTWRTSAGPPRQ